MNFLKKKLENLRHHRNSECDFVEEDSRRVPVNHLQDGTTSFHHPISGHPTLQKTRSGNNNFQQTPSYLLNSNNGYAGDISRSAPKHSLLSTNSNAKPLFNGQADQHFSTWPDDEFNDGPNYVDPTQNEDEQGEYEAHEAHDLSIGQTGFFGNDSNSDEPTGPTLPPPLIQPKTPGGGNNLSGGGGRLFAQKNGNGKTSSSSLSSTPKQTQGVGGLSNQQRSALSSAPSSASVSRHESVSRRLSGGTIDQLVSSSDEQQQQLIPQLPQRPQPKVLGSRISEGLDPNKVFTGIQAMVKMNQQQGNKAPQTPPKPVGFAITEANNRSSRFVHPPPTVTPPDSDECEPELPSRIKAMMVNGGSGSSDGSSSPSPPSSEASSGTAAPPAKKRQAPAPPPGLKATTSMKIVNNASPDAPLPPPVPGFKVAEPSNQTPSVTSSSDAGDDLLPPMPPPALMNKDSILMKHRLLLQHTTSSPITITPETNSTFANRPSAGNSNSAASSGIGSSLSSTSSSNSASSNKLPIKLPVSRQNSGQNLGSTAFTSSSSSLLASRINVGTNVKAAAVQVTVVSTGSDAVNGYGSSTGTAQSYTSDDDIYSGAESLQYNLFTFDWYHGKMSRDESERRLRENGQDGAFLVRDCNNAVSQPNALFTLCLFARNSCHYIQVCRRPEANDRLAVGSQKESEKTFATLQELIQFHMNEAPLVVQPRATAHDTHPQQFLCSLKHPIVRNF